MHKYFSFKNSQCSTMLLHQLSIKLTLCQHIWQQAQHCALLIQAQVHKGCFEMTGQCNFKFVLLFALILLYVSACIYPRPRAAFTLYIGRPKSLSTFNEREFEPLFVLKWVHAFFLLYKHWCVPVVVLQPICTNVNKFTSTAKNGVKGDTL